MGSKWKKFAVASCKVIAHNCLKLNGKWAESHGFVDILADILNEYYKCSSEALPLKLIRSVCDKL